MSKHSGVFWKVAPSFAAVMLVFGLVQAYPPAGLAALAAGGLVAGALVSLFTKLGERKLASQGFDAGDMGPIQERQVTLNVAMGEAFTLCKAALLQVRKAQIVQEDPLGGEINASTGMTLRSFGEKLAVHLVRITEDSTQVLMRSEPALKTTRYDYGKAAENVGTFLKALAPNTQVAPQQSALPSHVIRTIRRK